MSLLEQKEEIEDAVLEEVANILKVPIDAIKKLDDALSFINNFNDNSTNHGPLNDYYCIFNPLEKYLEAMEENKKLYQQLLKENDAMIEELKKK